MITKRSVSKTYERLFVQSSIFLDNYAGICGKPYVTLCAYKDAISEWYGPYEIYISICDYDSRKEYYIAEVDLRYIPIVSYCNCLGETVFLTSEEAEKKLEELKK